MTNKSINKLKAAVALIIIIPLVYYIYRGVENYYYLKNDFFDKNLKDSTNKKIVKSIILQNTETLKIDTLNSIDDIYVLNFSATWCKPCLTEIPVINKIYEGEKRYRYKFYYILQEDIEVINAYSNKHQLKFATYKLKSEIPSEYSFSVFPTTIISKKGYNSYKIEGEIKLADTLEIYKIIKYPACVRSTKHSNGLFILKMSLLHLMKN